MHSPITIVKIFKHFTPNHLSIYLYERFFLLDSRFRILIVYLDNISGAPVPETHHGLKLYCLNDKPLNGFSFRTLLKIRKILKAEQAAIVDCNQHSSTVYGVLAALFLKGVAVLSHVHGLNRCRTFRRQWFYRLFGRNIRKAIACSDAVADDIRRRFGGALKDRTITLANSVNYARYAEVSIDKAAYRKQFDIPDDAFVFIAAGRLAPTKSFDLLIRAFAQVCTDYKNAYLLIAGEGEERNALEKMIADFSIQDKVRMPGFRMDLPQLYKMSDCFVLSSCREGMPLVVLEAMSAGLNIIATTAGGTGEILENGKYGYLIPSNDLKALATAINSMMTMPESHRKCLAQSASDRVANIFSHQRLSEQLAAIYLDTVQPKQ